MRTREALDAVADLFAYPDARHGPALEVACARLAEDPGPLAGAAARFAAFLRETEPTAREEWFTRTFDRFLVFAADGSVVETPEPRWDVARVDRAR